MCMIPQVLPRLNALLLAVIPVGPIFTRSKFGGDDCRPRMFFQYRPVSPAVLRLHRSREIHEPTRVHRYPNTTFALSGNRYWRVSLRLYSLPARPRAMISDTGITSRHAQSSSSHPPNLEKGGDALLSPQRLRQINCVQNYEHTIEIRTSPISPLTLSVPVSLAAPNTNTLFHPFRFTAASASAVVRTCR